MTTRIIKANGGIAVPDYGWEANEYLGAGVQRTRNAAGILRGDQGAMSCWVSINYPANDGVTHPIMGLAPINANPASQVGIVKLNVNQLGLFIDNGGGIQAASIGVSPAVFPRYQWHHLYISWSAAAGEFWMDGTLRNSRGATNVGDQVLPAGAEVYMGNIALGNANAWIRNPMFWNEPLPQELIPKLWRMPMGFSGDM